MREPPALACPVCGRPIVQRGRWGLPQPRYCSALCRQRAKLARQTATRAAARAAGAMEAG